MEISYKKMIVHMTWVMMAMLVACTVVMAAIQVAGASFGRELQMNAAAGVMVGGALLGLSISYWLQKSQMHPTSSNK